MLAAKGMLESLSGTDNRNKYEDHNDDYDFGAVLEFCSDGTDVSRKIRCADGQEASFSFDD